MCNFNHSFHRLNIVFIKKHCKNEIDLKNSVINPKNKKEEEVNNNMQIVQLILKRSIFTTSCQQQVNIKQVKMMKKIMVGREKGKRRFVCEEFPKMVTAEKMSNPEKQGKEGKRRSTVLNKLFMKNVTDLMASSGMFAEKIFGYGIQISTVKVSQDFKKLNIYWFTSTSDNDKEIDKILKSIAGPLRHELSVLRLMGEIPQINFCRDKSLFTAASIDSLLQKADFGEDFIPTDLTLFQRAQTKLEMKLPDHLKQKIRELDDNDQETDEFEIDEDFPEMRHDVFGLDHNKIMRTIVANINKSSRAWEMYKSEESSNQNREEMINQIRNDANKLIKQAENREEFIKFLEKKQFERKNTPERKKSAKYIEEYEEETLEVESDPIPDNDIFYEEDENK